MIETNKINIRFAQIEDREAVLAFCQNTWENQSDYIVKVWDKWFIDTDGKIFVAVINDIPVGVARILLMSNSEAWLEGLRVDSIYRGRGIASTLDLKIQEFLVEKEVKTTRTLIASNNAILEGMLARRGRKKIASYTFFRASSDMNNEAESPELVQLDIEDFDEVWKLINNYEVFNDNINLHVIRGAKWGELTYNRVENYLKNKTIWGYKEEKRLKGLIIKSFLEGSQKMFWTGYIAGVEYSLTTLLFGLKKLSFKQGYPAVGGYFTVNDNLLDSFKKAGFQALNEEEAWLYEWVNF